jgi:hypothetical protein
MTADPIHQGTICQGGTTCQATATDRRLGDYFSVDVDNEGMLYAGYSDTRRGGSVSLPAFVRQNGGAPLVAGKVPPKKPQGQPPVKTPPRTGSTPTRPDTHPATGLPAALPLAAVAAAVAAVAVTRRRRSEA